MSNLKVSFSSDFFSDKAKRNRVWQIKTNRDQLCADISDIYQSANAILKSEIKFDNDDVAEVQRADSYDIVAGIPLVEKSICDLKITLSKAGLKKSSEQDAIIALMLQTKCGLQGKLLSQITALVLEHGSKSWLVANKKVSVDYDKVRRETIFKAQVDIVSKGKTIGNSKFCVAVKDNKISLKQFTFEIDKNANGAKTFIKNIRKDEGIVNKIINLFSSLFASTIAIEPTHAKIEPLKGKYLKPMREVSADKMRKLYAVSDSRIKSGNDNLPRKSESVEIIREASYKPIFKSKSSDNANTQVFEQKMQERQAKHAAEMEKIEKHQQEVRDYQLALEIHNREQEKFLDESDREFQEREAWLAEQAQTFEDRQQRFDAITRLNK